MLPRSYINPEDHWVTSPRLPYSQAVRCGDLIVTTGQVALAKDLSIIGEGDLAAQAKATVNALVDVLESAGVTASDLVHMRVFYVQDGTVNEDRLAAHLGACLDGLTGPGPALVMIPVEMLMSPGILIEIEGIAMRGQNGETLRRTVAWDPEWAGPPHPFSHALRVGKMLFTGGMTARDRAGGIRHSGNLGAQSHVVLKRLDGLLRQLGADIHDAVKTNVFNVEPGTAEDWAEPALIRAGYYPEPGPCATGLCARRLWPDGMMVINDIIAMRGEDGARLPRTHVWPDDHWDWTVHLPYRHGIRCGDLVFLGGQVPLNPDASVACIGDLEAQTTMSMDYIRRVLGEFNLGFENVLRINTFYATGDNPDKDETLWKTNLHARFAHFRPPGPATTGIPVPYLVYPDMNIEIDVIAAI